jgi:octaheme c-type cytochrome (tetrathionate reductase family)
MRKTTALVAAFLIPIIILFGYMKKEESRLSKLDVLKEKISKKETKPVDHSKFEQLTKAFSRPQDVTNACITCHNERHKEVMKSSHWRWLRDEYMQGRGIVSIGKRNLLNNHCISISGSEGSCNRCHAGYGYDNKNFDFTKAENIDCLACHDNSGTYAKAIAGLPKPEVDLNKCATSVGKPKMENCGPCHFDGGGGNNAKHGDLEEALYNTTEDIDVHLGKNGAAMECVDCHSAVNHVMKGKLYTVSSMNRNRMLCQDCHTATPHKEDIINEHTVKVACQTCHIPTFAKVNATKVAWDWSKAGDLKNGEPYVIKDSNGNEIYQSIKGKIDWKKNLTPEYKWFNGTARHYLFNDTATIFPIIMNPISGNYHDPDSKITPFKIMRTKQPYDPVLKKLLSPKLWDKERGKGAYWLDFNWDSALTKGMEYLNSPYSGKYTFVNTESNWVINHMVSPKEKSLQCIDCHQRNDSRIAQIRDVYLPGRDYSPFVDYLGFGLIAFTFLGAVSHGSARIYFNKKNKNNKGI